MNALGCEPRIPLLAPEAIVPFRAALTQKQNITPPAPRPCAFDKDNLNASDGPEANLDVLLTEALRPLR
jgi:hypothetical protein